MKKYFHVINIGIQNNLTYRFNFLMRTLFGLIPLVAMLYVWRTIYEGKGLTTGGETIAYCRIGERSAHTWFVLRYLLGHDRVRNYDGSGTGWGSLIGVPIEKG